MIIPASPWTMMAKAYFNVLPDAHRCLNTWKNLAKQIPDPELRRQALMSIRTKTFHCEGGAAYGLLAGEKCEEAIRFIVAYQTISDYLDNLCDRSTSVDPTDFRALHESMLHALTPGARCTNYYRLRNEQDDGGYLTSLVTTCQVVLEQLPAYDKISSALHELEGYYCDLQVYKHVKEEDRVPRLKEWFEAYRNDLPEMSWYEFSACCGSTLGIFCLVACAFDDTCSEDLVSRVKGAYFPWVQGFHILLDYFIDQEEDRVGRDLNFCSFYKDEEEMLRRLTHFFNQADRNISGLPSPEFHRMVNRGLFAIYLSDKKVSSQETVQRIAKKIIRLGGWATYFFYVNGWIYRRIKQA
ncbi:MAG: tetraprenyl-beta-curcumene synthase family protein [Deltaproteobacteria bacterium]|nr:tetraprenyl-beta-curcumene synthase family protein [Deltaproteobacteria bacterium]